MGQNGFYFSQMESAKTFIENIKASDLKMDEKEFNEKREKYQNKIKEKNINNNIITKAS